MGKSRIRAVMAGAAVGWALALSAAWAQEPQITVIGEAQARAVPDMARLSLGVEARSETAAVALSEVSERIDSVLAVLRNSGIAPADMQTSGVSVNPEYDAGPRQEGPARLVGHVASSDLSVAIRDLELLGALIDEVTQAGGNRISGLSFDVQDRAPLLEQARRDAVGDARARAEVYAGAAGLSLGPVLVMSETMDAGGPMPMMEAASFRSMPVAAGEIEISARIRMVFTLTPQPAE